MSPRALLRRLLRRCGIDVVRNNPEAELARRHFASHPRVQLARYLSAEGIDVVLDIGANTGQYATRLRKLGFQGAIVSFEPLAAAHAELARRAALDPRWRTCHLALGERSGKRILHVAGNSLSSSFLDMAARHREAAPQSAYVAEEETEVRTLDEVLGELELDDDQTVYLKLDAQGSEKAILDGARHSLGRLHSIQLELSLWPLYEGEGLFPEMLARLDHEGFDLVWIEPAFKDPTSGRILQLEGLFRARQVRRR